MADIKFACPHCAQHITCDELWGGHQLECPNCKNPLTVPAQAAPSAAAAAGGSLVPKPPAAPQPRLAVNAQATAPAGAPQRVIPIRNLAPAKPKKRNPIVTFATIAAVLVVLAVGGYFGYGFVSNMQNKVNAASKDAAKNADESQVGHIANLYSTLDATDPSHMQAAARAKGPRQRRTGVGQPIPVSGTETAASGSNAPSSEPLIPAVWTLDLAKAHTPSGRANGTISGTNFVPDTARVDPVGSAQVLRLLQGQLMSPDREVLIYLHLKAGEKLGGQTLNVTHEMAGVGVPQITKRWKTNPRSAPYYKSFTSGYAMRLELGEATDGAVPGKIFLALPDVDQSVVAGTFNAIINTNAPAEAAATVQAAPVMTPARVSTDAAMQARYGTRRSQ